MSLTSFVKHRDDEGDILTPYGYDLVIDDWIFRKVPCVLLYKSGLMDIYPIDEYTNYELTMLQRDSSYKSAWIPIGYGSFVELQNRMYKIVSEGPGSIDSKSVYKK